MRKIQDADIQNKKVLLRADFNVAIENGKAKEAFKIAACEESVKYLLEKDAKVALISHLGRPEGKSASWRTEFSLGQIVKDIENILGVKIIFIDNCIGEKVNAGLNNLKGGEILLLENVRFYSGDEANGEEFAKQLSENFDVFINDAFSVCHRDQASVTGVANFLPSYAGFWLQKEIENLDKIKNNPEHPATAIIGGAKIETKVPLINRFEGNYDYVLIGSKIAAEAKDRGLSFSEKVVMPIDYSGDGLDIGPKTISKFKEIITSAKTIIWNGPVGKFEESPYDRGTKEILNAIIGSGAFSVVGGGESVEVLEENGLLDKISFVSTGGGAMLEYLSGKELPGIKVLE